MSNRGRKISNFEIRFEHSFGLMEWACDNAGANDIQIMNIYRVCDVFKAKVGGVDD